MVHALCVQTSQQQLSSGYFRHDSSEIFFNIVGCFGPLPGFLFSENDIITPTLQKSERFSAKAPRVPP
jgi:hypothetical protein